MRRFFPATAVFCSVVFSLASCGKSSPDCAGHTSAIRLTVSGVKDSKASVITVGSVIEEGFNISAYVTSDVTGIAPGIFVDPGSSVGTDNGNKLKDILVTYDTSRDNEPWRITGNDGAGYAGHKFSWYDGVAMNFFAYAPVSAGGRTITKADNSIDSNYPFTYTTPVRDGVVVPSDCADLVFAFAQHAAEFESDCIDIKFYHALAQIRFCLSTDDGTYDPSYELVSVRLKDIRSKGNCTFNGASHTFDWPSATLDVQKDFLQTFNASFTGSTPSGWTKETKKGSAFNLYTNTGDVLLVIPQSLSECEVEVVVKQGESTFTLSGRLPVTTAEGGLFWEAGKCYTYKIRTSEQDKLSLSMTLVDWAEREDYIPID